MGRLFGDSYLTSCGLVSDLGGYRGLSGRNAFDDAVFIDSGDIWGF